jgi:dipeptidyl aminopeptidase/acylaminoacyl peptidase
VHSAARRPPEVVVYEPGAKDARRITDGMIGGIVEDEFVEPDTRRFATFDRKTPALLYRPRGAAPDGGFPALLWIHGGPEAQEQPRYQPLFQYLLSRGIAILAPNIRGSTGYGKSYRELVYRDFGGDDLRDLEAATRFLKGIDFVDPERLAVAGGSYGGFAALSCATRLPEHWSAAVDVFGPSNLVTFARSVPPSWRRFMREWVGDPDEEAAELIRRSPITYVDALRCPLLVIQGARDPRVVKAESDQMVARIRENGGAVEYLVFDDEGHGFMQKSNERRAFQTIADFLTSILCQARK